jgi:hypothetical protein
VKAKLGFIGYNGDLKAHSSLLNVVLYDNPHLRTDEEKRELPERG